VKIADSKVQSTFTSNLVSVLSVILRCNLVHIIFVCVLIFTMSRSLLNCQCQMKILNMTLSKKLKKVVVVNQMKTKKTTIICIKIVQTF